MDYRLYPIDSSGHINGVEPFQSDSDQLAAIEVDQRVQGRSIECGT